MTIYTRTKTSAFYFHGADSADLHKKRGQSPRKWDYVASVVQLSLPCQFTIVINKLLSHPWSNL